MKKLFYLAFCLTVAMSLGCVALIYPNVTDNEGSGQFSVTTKMAHLEETTQTSQTVGSRRIEHVAFLDQDKNGDHRLVGYAMELAVGTSEFHSDTFCNSNFVPGGAGACAWLQNVYTPPGPCSFTAPGVSLDLNCLDGFSAVGLCFSSRPGECGDHDRAFAIGGGDRFSTGLDKGEMISLLGAATEDSQGWLNFNINQGNTSLVFDNGTQTFFGSLVGNTPAKINPNRGTGEVDFSGSNMYHNWMNLADIIQAGGQADWSVTVTYNGVTRTLTMAFLEEGFYRDLAARNY